MTLDFQDVLRVFRDHGVLFEYPDIWELSQEESDGDMVVTVAASETSFWLLRVIAVTSPPPQVVESCVIGFREEYDDVEVDTPDASLAEMPAAAADVSFVCMDLLNSAVLRSVRTADFTLLVWWQCSQEELQDNRPVFEHMTGSVRVESMLD